MFQIHFPFEHGPSTICDGMAFYYYIHQYYTHKYPVVLLVLLPPVTACFHRCTPTIQGAPWDLKLCLIEGHGSNRAVCDGDDALHWTDGWHVKIPSKNWLWMNNQIIGKMVISGSGHLYTLLSIYCDWKVPIVKSLRRESNCARTKHATVSEDATYVHI